MERKGFGDMDTFETIVAVVLIGTVSEMYRTRLKARNLRTEDRKQIAQLVQQVRDFEERLANMESLVVEQEKHAEFDRALHE